MKKPAPVRTDLNSAIRNRWSGRAFDSQRALSAETVLALKEAAHWAPSCYGDAPWRFLFCARHTHPESWQKVFEGLMELNQIWAKNAPLFVVAMATDTFRHNGAKNRFAEYDLGAASENLSLQATTLGLMAHQMAGFFPEKVRTSFGIPEDIHIMSVIAVGYPGEPETALSVELRSREAAPRERPPLEKHFFDGKWES